MPSRSDLLLSSQRALLGAINPDIAVVSFAERRKRKNDRLGR